MKRQKRMIILLGILAVCTAGTVAVSRIDFEEKMSETETAIIDIDSADITRLAWNYEEEVSFVRQDGEWQYEADEKMAVDQELLDEIAENLSQITSDKMVEEVQALSVYGLSDPAYSITVETEEGRAVSREEINKILPQRKREGGRNVDTHIKNLRRRLDLNDVILSVRSVGYRIDEERFYQKMTEKQE